MKKADQRGRKAVAWVYEKAHYQHVLEAAAKPFPGISLQIQSSSDFKKPYLSALIEELQAPFTPLAVFPVQARDAHPLIRRGWLKTLNAVFSDTMRAAFAPEAMGLVTSERNVWGLTDDLSPYCWVVRQDLLPPGRFAPARTWAALERQLREWRRSRRARSLEVYGGGHTQRYGFLLALLGANGCSLADGLERMLQRREAMVEAYEWMRRMVAEGLLNYPSGKVKLPSAKDRLLNGEVISCMTFVNGLEHWPLEIQQDLKLLPFPRGPHGKDTSTPFNGSIWCVPHNTASLDVAFALLTALTKPDAVREAELAGGTAFPAARALWKDPAVLKQKPIYRDAARVMPSSMAYSADFHDTDLQELQITFRRALENGHSGEAWLKALRGEVHRLALRSVGHHIVREAMVYIDEHLDSISGVGDVADAVGRHVDSLNRIFQKEIKTSCRSYLLNRRMEYARLMLGDLTYSVKDIAYRLGFAGTPSFSRAFRNHWGCTPMHMRNKELRRIRRGDDQD